MNELIYLHGLSFTGEVPLTFSGFIKSNSEWCKRRPKADTLNLIPFLTFALPKNSKHLYANYFYQYTAQDRCAHHSCS